MRNWIWPLALAALCLAPSATALAHKGPAPRAAAPLKGLVVVVDAGHGGRDFGGQVPGVDEKDLILPISRRIAAALRRTGAAVVETRQSDANLIPKQPEKTNLQRRNLEARVQLGVRSGAHVFLSVHANKYSDSSARGSQVFIGDTPDPARQLLGICLSNALATTSGSRRMLDMQTNLYLMRHLPMPAALLEVGFMTSPSELGRMQDPAYQEDLARAVVRGVTCYVRGQEALGRVPTRPNPARPASGT